MRNASLINLGAVFSIGVLGANIDCSNKEPLTAVDPSISQSLQPCIDEFCTSLNNTKTISKSFKTFQCQPVVLKVTHTDDNTLPKYDRDRCIADFSAIVSQCLIAQGLQGGTLAEDAFYEVESTQNKAARKRNLLEGDDMIMALADQQIRRLEKRKKHSKDPKESETQMPQRTTDTNHAAMSTKPTTLTAESTKTATPTVGSASSTKTTTVTNQPTESNSEEPTRTKPALPSLPKASGNSCKPPQATGKLKKRATPVTCKSKGAEGNNSNRTSIVQLYKTVDPHIATGETRVFSIDPKKGATYGATQYIGCTAVIVITGKQILFGQYPKEVEDQTRTVLYSMALTKKYIIDSMKPQLNTVNETHDIYASLMYSGNKESSGNETSSEGVKEVKTFLEQDFACAGTGNFHWTPQHYDVGRVNTNQTLVNQPEGKIIVTVTPLSNEEVEINIYNSNDTPKWSKRFNAEGKPCV